MKFPRLYKLLPLLIPIAFFVAAAILITCNGCTPKHVSDAPSNPFDAWTYGETYVAPRNDCCETISFPMYEANCGCGPSREAIKAAREANAGRSLRDDPDSVHYLPHRPINELTNWGQGRNPGSNDCPPGTVRYELDDGLFLECMR